MTRRRNRDACRSTGALCLLPGLLSDVLITLSGAFRRAGGGIGRRGLEIWGSLEQRRSPVRDRIRNADARNVAIRVYEERVQVFGTWSNI